MQLPAAAPRPTAQYQARQRAAADRDDYGDEYGKAYRDYPDDDRDARPSARRPRRRGQAFSGLVVVLALIVSALLGVLTYQTLASVDLISANPLGALEGRATTLVMAALGALVVFVLAVIAIVVARPKALAGLGLLASVLLPVGAVILGVMYGGEVLRQNVEKDVAAAGPNAVDAVVKELERKGLDIGPLRDLLPR